MTSARKTTLIGLGGYLRSGKDAVADHLVETAGFVKLGMSDALHQAMLALDPWVLFSRFRLLPERYSARVARLGYVDAKKHPEVRRLLQRLGTEVGRNMIDENVWSNITARRVAELRADGRDVVVTGIRYGNELTMVDELGGIAVWVRRPGFEPDLNGAHSSETSISERDFGVVMTNDGTLAELYARADSMVARVAGA